MRPDPLGFRPLARLEGFMERHDPDVYLFER